MQPSEKYNTDSTVTYGTTVVNLTKNLSALYPTVNTEIDNTISISRFNNSMMQSVYRKSDKYNSLYDDAITICGSPTGSSDVVKYYKRSSFPVDNVLINNAIVYGTNNENRVYATGYSGDAGSVYNVNSAGNLQFIRDLEYNKIVFSVTAKEYASITTLPKGTIDFSNGSHSTPSTSGVDLKDIDPDKFYMGYDSLSAKIWNGSGWSDIQAHPILLCNGDTVQSIQSAGTAFYSEIPQYGMIMGSGATPSISVSSTSALNSGQNFCNEMLNNKYTLGWSDVYSTAPNWIDIHENIFEQINQYMIDHSQSSLSCTISREIISVSDSMSILISVVGQFSRNSTRIYYATINCMFYPMLKGSALIKLLAGFGCYYRADSTLDMSTLTPDTLSDSSSIWLGAMNSDGTTSGTWIKGADIANYNGYNKNGSIDNPAYNPSGGGGSGSDEDNDDPIPAVAAPYSSGLARYYVTTVASPILGHISEAFGAWNLKESGKDLYRNIISCKLIKSPAPIPVSGSEPFTVYGVTLQYEGSDITLPVVNDNPTASFGSYRIPRKFNDFRDYAPYTKVEIYLPYCGWTVLPSHVVGRSVSVTYYTDIIAATCKAVVYCGSNVVAEAAGVIGLDIPMITENAGAKAEAVTMGLLAYGKAGLQTALGVGAAVATKGKAGVKSAVGGLENLVSAYSQTAMAFNQNYTEINGKNGDGCCIAGISAIVIKITRPKYGANTDAPYVPSEYGHSTGFVSMKSAAVGSFTGLLVADNVDTSGISGATDREKQLIKLYLESGIYVNHPN